MAINEVIINRAELNALTSRTGPIARDLARRGRNVETDAKRRCPVNTGRLRSSIQTSLSQRGYVLIATVGSNVVYARYLENGTIYIAAYDYLKDALPAGTR